ncbi:MAG TPA: cytochrome c [Tepidisphaeraceae bacterium]
MCADASPPPRSTMAAASDRGRVLYAKHCAECHGPNGQGDGSAGRDLDPLPSNLHDPAIAKEPDAKLFRQITRGRKPMPSFGRLLNDDDRWTLVAFVKSLAASGGARPTP